MPFTTGLEISITSISVSFLGEGGRPVDESGQDGDGVKTADVDALDHLGRQGADLDADQRADQHAHGQGVEDVPVDGVLG